jgi:hypothetical protein
MAEKADQRLPYGDFLEIIFFKSLKAFLMDWIA